MKNAQLSGASSNRHGYPLKPKNGLKGFNGFYPLGFDNLSRTGLGFIKLTWVHIYTNE